MAEKRTEPTGETKHRRGGKRGKGRKPQAPVTTGDMQEVGATEPSEVAERRRKVDAEPPVHEDPGGQVAG
jgi:hypothetical protein